MSRLFRQIIVSAKVQPVVLTKAQAAARIKGSLFTSENFSRFVVELPMVLWFNIIVRGSVHKRHGRAAFCAAVQEIPDNGRNSMEIEMARK